MYDVGRVLSPVHIEAVVQNLKLDDFDAQELHRQAAIEAGFKINLVPAVVKHYGKEKHRE